ncbi:TPA: acetyl-CoA carboxylase biotin carboxylase subunit [Legionella pneumophila]|uniref:acetyl-CoA carboxylase biotin carboxylase subunit n=1 Tax=Legionella pneumophila TaxID=446 RepID=UPI000786AF7A|nr:acetyl-CoA carboxylase biotin carboxylase subunit [Legionella pneumophila]HAT1660123.1 acetyl-CoA carboxylase biotin carboxylase subunit [Legionella pneumophila]HAT1882906.1 acetyl-CoA carboxylase biotin carboxylase subunit [Legionella pneumophila]HAT2114277.1 acetyl-CoA carboxylase biotin carboxylase subunit [Legionella pneumophila]HAT8123525.1 acetyl-CoA carboxylase biotin carboxylase subunit [Legionella pneumophila]HAT8719689.1 acetyl-CoA carboxylase biotin carboxylase subunit [Legionell
MFKKILVANRGEIALRIVRACKEMGIAAVTIHSEVDRFALHVKRASHSHCLSKKPLEAYLNGQRIIECAKVAGCEAIHPGYGFLSENAEFAEDCSKAGIIFIGPSASVIATMGSKIAAREAMIKAGVPIIPGSKGNLETIDDALCCAETLGYPVMLKATFGGGGRGIRLCHDASQIKQQFARVQSEAEKSFGDSHVYMEKYIANPRHIEVQILADHYGTVLHLFERDCSIQRRHQKLVEIAPSPQLDEATRKVLLEYAVKAAKEVGYTNAGTVEFILDKNNQPYFMEMNTRLQVEHPITEQITGIDLVQEQIRIAAGERLSLSQDQIKYNGFAIEFRINAEDPQNDFLPSFGRITRYYAPGGPGVRTDSAIYTGYQIPPDYDSLCAKLTVWALDWPSVLRRAHRALEEMRMFGVKTTIPYYLEMIKSDEFQMGAFNTGLVEAHPEWLRYSNKALPQHKAAVIAAAIALYKI